MKNVRCETVSTSDTNFLATPVGDVTSNVQGDRKKVWLMNRQTYVDRATIHHSTCVASVKISPLEWLDQLFIFLISLNICLMSVMYSALLTKEKCRSPFISASKLEIYIYYICT